MESFALFHFAVKKNDRVYQIVLQPGSPWSDIDEVLADFKSEFAALRAKADAEEAAKETSANPITPEVVEPKE